MDSLALSADSLESSPDAPSRTATDLRERLASLRALPGIAPAHSSRNLLFSLLPTGLPRGSITELSGPDGCGKTEAAIRALAENPETRGAWIEDTFTVYPCAFPQLGVAMERVLFVESGSEHFLWALHQVLRSQLFEIVVATPPRSQEVAEVELRRLQLSSERSRTSLLWIRERPTLRRSWPIRIQAEIRRDADETIRAHLVTRGAHGIEVNSTADGGLA